MTCPTRLARSGAVLSGLLAGIAGCSREAQAPSKVRDEIAACAVLKGSAAFEQTEVTGTTRLPAEGDLPARCEVQAVIRPAEGSEIGVVYRLPDNWNGKLLALGGGGWMGNTTPEAAAAGLGSGYATLQTDAGHIIGTVFDAVSLAWLGKTAPPRPTTPASRRISRTRSGASVR